MNPQYAKTRPPAIRNLVGLITLGLAAFCAPVSAATLSLDFACITHNSVASCAAGEHQLHAQLEEGPANTATFRFWNLGDEASVIARIYFNDPAGLLGRFTTLSAGQHGQVSFESGARPANLPGGKALPVAFLADLSLGAARPSPKYGLNNGGDHLETLSVTFMPGRDFASLRAALASGELRLGIHAQGFANGASESFVNEAAAPVPVPETVWLFASGLFGFVGIARRRKEKGAVASDS